MTTHLHADDPASALRIAGREALVDQQAGGDSNDDFDALTDLFLGSQDAHTACESSRPSQPTSQRTSGDSPDEPGAPSTPQPALRLAQDLRQRPAAQPTDSARVAPPRTPSVEALILSHLPVTSGPWAGQCAAALASQQHRPVALLTLLADRTALHLFGSDAPVHPGEASQPDSLDAAINRAAALDPLWLVRSDALREAELLASPAITGAIVLTSADEAATIAAYRVLKGVHGALAARAGGTASLPRMGLGIVGADEERARNAAASLCRAAKTFLDCPVEAGLTVPSMTSTRSMAFYDAESGQDPSAALAAIARAQQRAAPSPPGADDANPSLEAGAMRPESLASLLDPPMSPLPTRCPHEKQVELALDHAGALRLLVRKSPRAFEAAAIVRAWASQHRELLELALRRSVADVERAPLHIFVESARDARRLLDADCRVHLIVHRNVRGEETIFAIDL